MGVQASADMSGASVLRRSRSVWTVLTLTALAFLVSCGSLGLWLTSTLSSVTTPHSASLEARTGSQLSVLRSRAVAPELVTKETTLNEGDEVQTSSNGGAFLQLFDGSTIQTYFDTKLRIERLRTSKFFQNLKEASIVVNSGTVVVVTADLGGYSSAHYIIATDSGVVEPDVKSKVRLRVEGTSSGKSTTVFLDYGSARLLAHGKQIQLTPGTMASVDSDGTLSVPSPIEEELLRNGNFTEGPTSGAELVENGGLGTAGWLPIHAQPADTITEPGVTEVATETIGTSGPVLYAIKLKREGTGDKYALVGIRQEVNQPVEFLGEIELKATVKIIGQSLTAGGPQGNLYPLTIKVMYTDSEQKQHEWVQSFYYLGPDTAPPRTTRVSQGTWAQPHFTLKSIKGGIGTDMAVINAIEVYGFGRQFQSWATDLSIIAR